VYTQLTPDTNMQQISHNQVIDQLLELGLQRIDAEVYLCVLTHGETAAGVVIEELQLHREQGYRSLRRLVTDGLLTSYEKDKKAYFAAISPEVLVSRMRSKTELAQSLVPYLHEMRTVRSQLIQVTEGDRSLQILLEDILKSVPENGEYLVLGGIGEAFSVTTKDYFPKFARALTKRGVRVRIISYPDELFEDQQQLQPLLTLRRLPSGHTNVSPIVIYANKVALEVFDHSNPDNTAVVTIENEHVAATYRANFEALWNIAKE
jgi:sugar-specific transcriptional regulator TrmB